ncbi:MAG: rhomboid family intramembrane serine protease [Spirochaetales bacterium]|nr:rhomboid family intramembrane serine protease [Spirochaetales bacterium]
MINNFKINKNINLVIIVISTLVFGISFLLYQFQIIRLDLYLGLNPILFIKYKHYWTPITYMFSHANFSHLFFNMFALFIFGHAVEEKMGSRGFLQYYIIIGALSGLFSLVLYWFLNINILLIGASGAIYALLFAYAVFYPNRKLYIFGLIPINPPTLILIYTAMDLYSHIFRSSNVAHLTHLSGFLFSFFYFKIVYKINPLYVFRNYKKYIQ